IADNLDYARRFPEASFIVSEMQEMDENGVITKENTTNESLAFLTKKKSTKEQLKSYARWPEFLNTPTFFYKRELMHLVGFCDEEFKIFEDTTVIFNIIGKNIKIHYLNKPTVKYRIHPNSISRNDSINERREKE